MSKGSFSDLINSETPVLVDFHAVWCGPCHAQAPILEQLKGQLGEGIDIYKIDVDKNPSIAQRYQVQSIPTLMIFRKGELLWRKSGVASLTELKQKISEL